MFDDPFVFFALLIAIVALIFARKAMNEVANLRERLDALQTAPVAAAVPVPPPLTPFEAFEPAAGLGQGRTYTAAHHSRRRIRRTVGAVRESRTGLGHRCGATTAAAAT
jgi:hypothetical protein